jgi:hypothetical protein
MEKTVFLYDNKKRKTILGFHPWLVSGIAI